MKNLQLTEEINRLKKDAEENKKLHESQHKVNEEIIDLQKSEIERLRKKQQPFLDKDNKQSIQIGQILPTKHCDQTKQQVILGQKRFNIDIKDKSGMKDKKKVQNLKLDDIIERKSS